jgi:tRNA(His) guanylyltransferase
VKHLLNCGLKISYAYIQSDEISLLFDKDENSFGRKTRKLVSILAGEASARFTKAMGEMGVFDCRLIPLPDECLVLDYFRWRSEDANRNALNAWCYWKLRDTGLTPNEATLRLEGKSTGEKNEILFQLGINYNDVPDWQKRGVGLYYEETERLALDMRNNRQSTVMRNQLKIELELPRNKDYDELIRVLLTGERDNEYCI